jgi:hypothetical protein
MIEIDTAANIAEIAGGIAILVSLLYVGYQIRQSNRIASATALQAVLTGHAERNSIINLQHPEGEDATWRGYQSWNGLSVRDKRIFNNQMVVNILHVQNVIQFHEKGLVNDVDYKAWLTFIASIVVTPGGKEWWPSSKVMFTPTIVAVLDQFIADNPSTTSILDMAPWGMES